VTLITLLFSTSRSPVSRIIRWLTQSTVSHVAVLYRDEALDMQVVLEASTHGYTLTAYEVWLRRNRLVRSITADADLLAGLRKVAHEMGEEYDYGGLFGMVFVLLGRRLKRTWHNPLQSNRALFCSEAVVKILQAGGCQRARDVVPETTSPEDLLQLLS